MSYLQRVEGGEILTIIHDDGLKVLMVPATQCQIGSIPRKARAPREMPKSFAS